MSDKQPHHGFLDSLKSMVVDETPDTTHASTPAAPAPAAPAASPFNFSFSSAPAASAGTSAPSGGAPVHMPSWGVRLNGENRDKIKGATILG